MALPPHRNIASTTFPEHGIVILVHGRKNPTDQEWEGYVRVLRTAFERNELTRVLVITDGGHPSKSQQTSMNATIPSDAARVAVISSSGIARFVASILVMTNPGIRLFSPEQRHQAYAHLGLSPIVAPQIDDLVSKLRRDLE